MKWKLSVIALSSLVNLAACEQKAEEKAPEAGAEAAKPAGEAGKPAGEAGNGAPAGGMAQGAASGGSMEQGGASGGTLAQGGASGGGAAAQPGAAPATSPWASKDKIQTELQGKMDAVATKVEAFKKKAEAPANKKNKKMKEQLTALHTKVDAARAELKNLAGSTEATFTEVKMKAEKSVQDLELAFEQANGPAGTN